MRTGPGMDAGGTGGAVWAKTAPESRPDARNGEPETRGRCLFISKVPSPSRFVGVMKPWNGDQSVNGAWAAYSASGWFSGRARSKAGSSRQAASMATILGNLSSGTFSRRAL